MAKSRLSRWSERKAQSRAKPATRGSAAPVASEPDEVQNIPELEASQGEVAALVEEEVEPTAEELAAEAKEHGLPDLETLDKDSDYSGFMSGKISEALKRAALRKLWRTDAVFANLDGLNDYDEDFNVIDTLITAAETNYKVGKGMVSESEEGEEELAEDETGEEAGVAENAEGEPAKKRADAARDDAEPEADGEEDEDVGDGDSEIA